MVVSPSVSTEVTAIPSSLENAVTVTLAVDSGALDASFVAELPGRSLDVGAVEMDVAGEAWLRVGSKDMVESACEEDASPVFTSVDASELKLIPSVDEVNTVVVDDSAMAVGRTEPSPPSLVLTGCSEIADVSSLVVDSMVLGVSTLLGVALLLVVESLLSSDRLLLEVSPKPDGSLLLDVSPDVSLVAGASLLVDNSLLPVVTLLEDSPSPVSLEEVVLASVGLADNPVSTVLDVLSLTSTDDTGALVRSTTPVSEDVAADEELVSKLESEISVEAVPPSELLWLALEVSSPGRPLTSNVSVDEEVCPLNASSVARDGPVDVASAIEVSETEDTVVLVATAEVVSPKTGDALKPSSVLTLALCSTSLEVPVPSTTLSEASLKVVEEKAVTVSLTTTVTVTTAD